MATDAVEGPAHPISGIGLKIKTRVKNPFHVMGKMVQQFLSDNCACFYLNKDVKAMFMTNLPLDMSIF